MEFYLLYYLKFSFNYINLGCLNMDMPVLNWIDYIVITLLAISTIVGLMRGFLKEVISLLTWIVAFAAAVLFSGRLAHFFSGTSGEVSLFAIGMCFIAIR